MTQSIQEAVLLGDRILILFPGPGRVRRLVANPAVGQRETAAALGVQREIQELLGNRFEMNTDLVFAGLVTVILIGLLVENLFFKWIERKTVLRWGMSAGH